MSIFIWLLIYITAFAIITGALARRHWGGWLHSNKYVRGIVFLALGAVISLAAVWVAHHLFLSPCAAVVAGLIGLIPQYSIWRVVGHGWAQGMGTWPDHPLPLCRVIFHGNYAIALAIQGAGLSFIYHGYAPQILIAIGLLAWIPHWLAQQVDFGKILGLTMRPADQGYFYDSKTVWGELGLGAIMFGALPAALLLDQLCAIFWC